ncbi:hypothetical protein ACFLW2_02745 [Chloroflexota bacterium]
MRKAFILRRFKTGQKGVTLLESVVSMTILAIVVGSIVTGLSTGMFTGVKVQDSSIAANLATSQLEDSLDQTYSDPPDYPILTTPEGYSVSWDNYVDYPTLLQTITAVVSNRDGETVIELTTVKVNESYIASPPTLRMYQRDFRWYENTDSITPTTPLAEENYEYTIRDLNQVYRLRMSLQIDQLPLSASEQDFKLQYSSNPTDPESWTDIAAAGAPGEIWRGYDNTTPADGATITPLLTTSDLGESYEEQNPSVTNPNAVAVGEWAEWDWVVEENGASYNTNYYFRMVLNDDSAFDSYTRYPVIVMPPPQTLTQHDYRWYENIDSLNPTTPLASQHTEYTSDTHGISYRLRMNIGVDGINLHADTLAFKLQYSTSISGPWTDVGDIGSGIIWRGYDNATPADGTAITPLLTTSDVGESYEEQNPSVTNPSAINAGQEGEWDWVIEDNGAADTTSYYFRMVESDGTELDSYTYYAKLNTPPPVSLTQQDYRWYENKDAADPDTALASENTVFNGAAQLTTYRLRMNIEVGGANLAPDTRVFKLQFATSPSGPWTDVGDIDSSVIWRGYDNATPADGTTITPLLTTSDTGESYEEQNPSIANPNLVTIGKRGEWGWVVQDYAAPGNTTYYFRMANEDETALNAYTQYPQITTSEQTMTQQDYRWYENTNSITPFTALAGENTAYAALAHGFVYRIRMNVTVNNIQLPADNQAFKLQYATSTSGPWTDIGATGSEEIWRGYDNTTPADGATIPSVLLSTSDVLESYEEQNSSALNPNAINAGQEGEWDWVIEDNGAADSTAYYFRMVKGNDSPLDTYTNYPQITTPDALTLTQQDYRWYENTDSITPTIALATENTAFSNSGPLEVYRLRMNVAAGGAMLPSAEQAFKLQYSTSTSGPWTDVGAATSGVIWRGYNNATPADGTTLTSFLVSTSDAYETYEEENPSAAIPNNIPAGQEGEWDWVIQNKASPGSTTYYFRMVESDGSALTGYTSYPQLTTAPLSYSQDNYRWYENIDNITPTTALAAENTSYSATSHNFQYRIRMNLLVGGSNLPATAQGFKLQYSTSTSGPWTDVGDTGSAEIWRGYDNATPADGATITTLLTTSDVGESYEEQNPSVDNPNTINIGQRGEWDWVVQSNEAAFNTDYYFRMVKADGTELDGYNNYPQITTPPEMTLTQQDYRWYQNIDSITPTVALAVENTGISGATPLTVYRLRMNVEVSFADMVADSETFKLQYATDTGGPWTDVGATGSGDIWRGYNNTTPADSTTLTSFLVSTSDVYETYEEQNPSVSNPNAINVGEQGEWDWVVQNNGVTGNTTYYFRMARSNGTALNAYSNYPQITTAPLTMTQQDYRWYANNNSITPTSPLAVENTAYVGASPLTVYRLRINMAIGDNTLPAGMQAYKLQYSTDTGGPWTDVGDIASGVIWRGYDITTGGNPADGATITDLLLTSSDVLESYEEENPSIATPNAIGVGQQGEWDWVIQNNTSPTDTYYFRMVKNDGTALDTYTNYAEITTGTLTMTQQDYRWYENREDSATPNTALAPENIPYTTTAHGIPYHLRMNIEVGGVALPGGAQAFKLQYSTDYTDDLSWTDVGAIGSGIIWRGYDNATPADGITIPNTLLSTSNTKESYEEENPSVLNPTTIPDTQRGEWAWVIENYDAAVSTTYYFRMVRTDGTALDIYTNYPQMTTAATQTFTQQDYRWYANLDGTDPTTPLANQNTLYTAIAHGDLYRLRMNVQPGGADLIAGTQAFKLQYSTSTSGPWIDVGAAASGVIWRGYDNASPADGATITSLLLTTSSALESYEEENPSVANPNTVSIGQRGEWDWVIEDNGAADSTPYYFRMVEADDTALNSYGNYPQITTPATQTFTQQDYRWYTNLDGTDPVTPLANENTLYSAIAHGDVYRLRMNVEPGAANLLSGKQAFKLQYSTSASGPWTDVGDIGSAELWRGYNNTAPADGATITSLLLSTSDVLESYEEQNPSVANPNAINTGQQGEWDWVMHNYNADISTTYYFRMIKADGIALDSYTNYPQITTAAANTFTQQDYRWYEKRNNITPNTPLANENTSYTATIHGDDYRLRMNVEAGGANLLAGSQAFKLQYSTSTSGPWTDVAAASAEGVIWRGYINIIAADGATISTLLSTSDVGESYEEENPSVLNPNAINIGQLGEWDWVLHNYNAAASTTYYFRMVKADGTALDSYSANYPQFTTAPPISFTQQDYHWYDNADSVNPGSSLTSDVENTPYTQASPPNIYRLRMNVEVGGIDMAAGSQSFKLQYSTSTSGPWTDVADAGAEGVLWRGYDNTSPADGATVAVGLLLTTSDVRGTYEESNPSAVNPYAVVIGELGEWDWVIQDYNAASEETYYFRMVRSDGTALDTYTNYPQITTIPPVIAEDNFESAGWAGGSGWLDDWSPSGDAAITDKDSPYEGSYHLRLRRDTGYVKRSVNLSGKTSVQLQFWARAKSFEAGETVEVLISSNGSNWTTVHTWVDGDDDDTYHFFDLDLSSYNLTSSFWIAFDANLSHTNDYFYVDDLNIVGQ